MILTLILSEEKLKPLGSKEKKASENIKKGILYENLKVCDINPDGLAVEVNGVKAVIPKNHLTDHAALADLLLSNYQINDTIEKALCFEKDVLPIMTLKPSILAFEQSDLAFDDLHQDQVLPTVVSNIKPYGVFAKLPLKKVRKAALIPLRLLSDNFVEDPNEDVQIQQTLYARITEIKEDKLTMTSKPSLVGFDEWKMTLSLFDDLAKVQNPQLENLQLGSVVNCKVQDVTQFGVDTILEDSNVRGLCPKAGFKDLEMPEKGETVAGVIVFLDHQFGVVELSMQPEIIERAMLVKIKKRPKEGQNVKAVCVLKRSELNLATFCIKSPNHAQGHFIHCPMMNLDKFDLFELYNIDIMHSDSRVVIGQIHDKRNKKRPRQTSESLSEKKPRLDSETEIKEEKPNDPGWDQDFNPWGTGILVENETKNEPMETEEAPAAAKKKIKTHLSKKEKKKLDELEEIAIQRAEQRAIEGQDLPPENVDEFDKLVLTSPDSSLCWIQYIAYHLERKEYDLARGVVKRALEKINFREENERFNVYMAWFNLENAYGTEDEANKVLKESLQCNDEFKVLAKVAEIYCASGKFEEAEEVLKKRARKFKKEIPVWLDLGLFYFKDKKDIKEARFVLQRALQNISQKTADIVMVSSKFAQFEFLHGESERGKTIFENIVRDYPSRSDQWSVYADMVVKNGEMEAAREIFERMITLGLPPKKMKSMFKKYWEFEQKHGDDVKVNAVRKKAVEYLEQQNVKLDEDEDPMEQLE